jgi:hypothetical protein
VLRPVTAIRYVTPLREGGSLPGVMEGDDLGTWVVKFRGAGQGRKALVAEVVVGELARRLGFDVPELVRIDVDPDLGRVEPDPEIQELLKASAGANLGVDYLPGSITYDPLAGPVPPELAARVLWLDAYALNVDRSWRNPNLLQWGGRLWLIDHGAALYPHHDFARAGGTVNRPLPRWEEHVLLAAAGDLAVTLAAADAELAGAIGPDLLAEVLAAVPPDWLEEPAALYVDWLLARRAERPWLSEMIEKRRSAPGGGASGGGASGGGSSASGAGPRRGRPDWLRHAPSGAGRPAGPERPGDGRG